MFVLKEIRSDINCISSNSKSFCFNTKQEELFLDNRKIDTVTSVCGYFFDNKYFTFSNKVDFTNTVINLNSNEKFKIGKVSLQFQKSESSFIAFEKIDGKRNLIVFDLRSSEKRLLKQNISFGVKLSNEDNLIINEGWTQLKSLSLLTGEYEWEVDLGEYGSIRKVIGIAGDRLWVSLINDKGGLEAIHTLAALHISDGQILQHHSFDWEFEDFGVLLVNNRLLSLKEQRLVEVDALEGNMLRNHRVLPLINNRFKIRSFTVFEDKIYFTANDSTQIVANTVGVLDYKTLELLWSSKVSPGNLNLDPPQVTEDRLYVLGAEGTLHIFEKNG